MKSKLLVALLFAACSTPEKPAARTPEREVFANPAPRAELDESEARLALSADRVSLVLAPQYDEIRNCLSSSGIEGSLKAEWEVDANGNASALHATSGDAPECLDRIIGSRHFDTKTGKPATASWTFVRKLPLVSGVRRAKVAPRRGKDRAGLQGTRFDVAGRLEANHVDEIVQGAFKLYAHCFRQGLSRDMRMHGKLALRFTVADDGQVSRVEDAGSEFGDSNVTDCAAEAFYALQFRRPRGGNVKITYAIFLNDD